MIYTTEQDQICDPKSWRDLEQNDELDRQQRNGQFNGIESDQN